MSSNNFPGFSHVSLFGKPFPITLLFYGTKKPLEFQCSGALLQIFWRTKNGDFVPISQNSNT
ncbi:MAG: hypothetical protein A2168_05150 [Planctomycetes bacterium RBG_13_50_24]|nr:MAG: hypothetical protein A2168_05150 [Planctomycetes bacterium RBG_13_50_24]